MYGIKVCHFKMTEIKIQVGPIYQGRYDDMKDILEKLPKDVKIFIEAEPYCNLQQKSVCNTFKLVLDDPRFVFDDLFIARQFYFSASQGREIVMKHPKFQKVVKERKYFMDYFYERYGDRAGTTHVGMLQRYVQAERVINFWKEQQKKKNQFRITFLLYPALIKHSRKFLERYYSPEGEGCLKAKLEFERHKHL